MIKSDISTKENVILLVNTFYENVKGNQTLGYIFNDVAKTNWQHHLPKMYSFWSSILLGEQSYRGNPMIKHIELSKLTTITSDEYSEWLFLFTTTIDELFVGETANEAKLRAENIARLMLHKIETT